MSIIVTSNNGRTHLAEKMTKLNPSKNQHRSELAKQKKPKKYPGYVRKLCDGQWVSEKRKVEGKITCPACSKL